MRALSPLSLTLLLGAAAGAAGIEISRRFALLSDQAARAALGRSALSSSLFRLEGRLAAHRRDLDRLHREIADAKGAATPGEARGGA